MKRVRVIPILLLSNKGLVKTRKFKDPVYIGDPINAIRIFNEKQVDELILLDIRASKEKREPHYEVIQQLASECFMPMGYGGGVTHVAQARQILNSGVEKVSVNATAIADPSLIKQLADEFGSQSVVVGIDVKKNLLGKYKVMNHAGSVREDDPLAWAQQMEAAGAGEILLTSVDREGSMEGYDLALIHRLSSALRIPVIANGGAGSINDFLAAVNEGGASAVAAGSVFVFKGAMRGILINYPSPLDLKRELFEKLKS